MSHPATLSKNKQTNTFPFGHQAFESTLWSLLNCPPIWGVHRLVLKVSVWFSVPQERVEAQRNRGWQNAGTGLPQSVNPLPRTQRDQEILAPAGSIWDEKVQGQLPNLEQCFPNCTLWIPGFQKSLGIKSSHVPHFLSSLDYKVYGHTQRALRKKINE